MGGCGVPGGAAPTCQQTPLLRYTPSRAPSRPTLLRVQPGSAPSSLMSARPLPPTACQGLRHTAANWGSWGNNTPTTALSQTRNPPTRSTEQIKHCTAAVELTGVHCPPSPPSVFCVPWLGSGLRLTEPCGSAMQLQCFSHGLDAEQTAVCTGVWVLTGCGCCSLPPHTGDPQGNGATNPKHDIMARELFAALCFSLQEKVGFAGADSRCVTSAIAAAPHFAAGFALQIKSRRRSFSSTVGSSQKYVFISPQKE